MTILRSALFNLAFAVVTLALAIGGLPALLGPRSWCDRLGRIWAGSCMALLKWIVGLEWETRGTPPAGPALVIAKHQSAWETLAFALLLDRPAFVLKRSLLWAPPYGPYLRRAGMIAIDRAAGASAIRGMVAGAKAALARGQPVVIFPEGTRRRPGAPPAYLPGVAALYRGLEVQAVPVALNSGLFWGRNAFAKRPGRVVIEFLDPIPAGLDRRTFMARLEDVIETATGRLIEEAEEARRVVAEPVGRR